MGDLVALITPQGTRPAMVAGMIIEDGKIVTTAPIMNRLRGRSLAEVLAYARRQGYLVYSDISGHWEQVTQPPAG